MTGHCHRISVLLPPGGWCALSNASRTIAVKVNQPKMPEHAFRGVIVPWGLNCRSVPLILNGNNNQGIDYSFFMAPLPLRTIHMKEGGRYGYSFT